jgi:hypothetical protein
MEMSNSFIAAFQFLAWVLVMLIASVRAEARIESLLWEHAGLTQREVAEARIIEKGLDNRWGTPRDVAFDSQVIGTGQAADANSIELDIAEDTTVIPALAPDNLGNSTAEAVAESVSGPEATSDPDPSPDPESTIGHPGSDLPSSADFDNGEWSDTRRWIDTAGSNSLTEDPTLFRLATLGDDRVLVSSNDQANVHSHLALNDANQWVNYEYSGRMRTDDASGSLGITAYSQYPASDSYYRIRAVNGQTFEISPHPNSSFAMTCSTKDTGISLVAGTWFHFSLRMETMVNHTNIRAKVWPSGVSEPSEWQIDCDHGEIDRLTNGTVGVWSMGNGEKYWDDLVIKVLSQEDEPAAANFLPSLVLMR